MINDLKGTYYLQYTMDPVDSCPKGVFEITITESSLGGNFVVVQNIDNLGNNVIGKLNADRVDENPSFVLSVEQQIYGGGLIEATLRFNSDKISGTAEVYKNHFGSYPCGGILTRKF